MPNSEELVVKAITQMTALLNAEDYAGLAGYYDYPFLMEVEDRSFIFVTPDEAMVAWAEFRSQLKRLGGVRSDFEITAMELPRMGRLRVWLTTRHLDARGAVIRTSDSVLFFRQRGQKIILELQHVTRKAIPAVWAQVGDRRRPG